jgi:hypothetical protein
MPKQVAVVSVDLDEVPCYAAIFGLEADAGSAHAIYDHAIDRIARLFESEGVQATFFVIGQDLARPASADKIRMLADQGHEIASHSYSHFYDLTRRDAHVIESEIARAEDEIERVVGERPVGFRAPGYTITDPVFEILRARGYRYDSSVFPSPPYFALKAAAIRAIAARGRTSHSIVDDPRVLTAPADPYRVGKPYWGRGSGIVELPIAVTRGARLPFIGTTVALAGTMGAALLARQMTGRAVISFELHGIDLADAREDGLSWLAPHQRDLNKTAVQKESALRSALRTLRGMGYQFATARDVAASVH